MSSPRAGNLERLLYPGLAAALCLAYLGALAWFLFPSTTQSPYHQTFITFRPLAGLAAILGLAGLAILLLRYRRVQAQQAGAGLGSPIAFVLALCLLGAVVRFAQLALVDPALPYDLAGLFVEFSKQIAANHYRLPVTIPFYTAQGLPYAYPPLPFYIEAFLVQGLLLPQMLVVNLLPPLVAALTLPLFYLMAREMGLSFGASLAALAIFALFPAGYSEQAVSAGLAEAFGTLALLAFVIFLSRANRAPGIPTFILAGLLWALCVLTSPGAAYASVLTFFVFGLAGLLAMDRQGRGRLLIGLVICGLTALALSAPYWLTVARNHGLGIFVDTMAAEHQVGAFVYLRTTLRSLWYLISGQSTASLLLGSVFVATTALRAIIRRHWATLLWLLLLAAVPRESEWLGAIPASVVGGLLVAQVFLPLLRRDGGGRLGLSLVLLAVVTLLALVVSLQTAYDMVHDYRRAAWQGRLRAMDWAAENLPPSAQLLVLSDEIVTEWTPTLAHRTVLNVWQGSEFQPDLQEDINLARVQLDACGSLDCVQQVSHDWFQVDDPYLFVETERLASLQAQTSGAASSEFSSLWEGQEIVVGQLMPATP